MSVRLAEEHLIRLLKSWRSRYRYTITVKFISNHVYKFDTEWSRRPTPHEPLPDIRVKIEFSLVFAKHLTCTTASQPDAPLPTITFRIEHETFIHATPLHSTTDGYNIDHHILRIIKFKSEFYKKHPLPMTYNQHAYFDTRFTYNPLPDKTVLSQAEINDVTSEDIEMEKQLIEMFIKGDDNKDGSLDVEEFEDLMLNGSGSTLGFSKEDIKLIMQQHDLNDDGRLVYREFIPIGIDLIQSQQASAYATTIVTRQTEQAYKHALLRIQTSKHLHRTMDVGLNNLDTRDTGRIHPTQLKELLMTLDIDMSEREAECVMSKLKIDSNGLIIYRDLQEMYESILLDTLQICELEKDATDAELYLLDLFKRKDGLEHRGTLNERQLIEVLMKMDRIKLSSTQIYALVGDHKPIDGQYKYKLFARKAAHMIYKLFDKQSLIQRSRLIARSNITPIALLGGRSKQLIEQQMRCKFIEFDTDNNGLLDAVEFSKALSDTSLCLSSVEIAALRNKADLNADSYVDINEFMKFAYETLLSVARDSALKNQWVNVVMQEGSNFDATAANPNVQ